MARPGVASGRSIGDDRRPLHRLTVHLLFRWRYIPFSTLFAYEIIDLEINLQSTKYLLSPSLYHVQDLVMSYAPQMRRIRTIQSRL